MEGDEQAKAAYMAKYKEEEGVELIKANIAKNPVKRFIAKLLLNR